jgi:allophanate hydrolase
MTVVERVRAAYRALASADRPEVWISLRDQADTLAEAASLDARVAAGERLPLAGKILAVKDNIDVAGLPTTAGCPQFAYHPQHTATAVRRLIDAGAIVLGKTNLDQFATGLVGTRSPYGAVRCAHDPSRISGGSSSGSAVAVALGIADLGIGTDTAGSGRVPAAFHGLIGIKPSLGLVPTRGVVPACPDYDTVTVFATDLAAAAGATALMAGPDPHDSRSRDWPADIRLAAPPQPRVAVPRPADLGALCPDYRVAFDNTVAAAQEHGICPVETDISVLLDAARLLYDGAIVAQRYAAVGAFVDTAPADLDPVVGAIVTAAAAPAAHQLVRDLDTLARAKHHAAELFRTVDGLLLPTTTEHPTLAEVAADPVGINRRMGTYTNFCNLLDLCAVAFPGIPVRPGVPFGAMIVAPGFADHVALDLAARLGDCPTPEIMADTTELAVFGAHLRGQPLHRQLVELGAAYTGPIHTSDAYRLMALDTAPPKPGLVRHRPHAGAPIAGESYRLAPAALGRLLATLPPPMTLTAVELSDGRWVTGFGCTQDAVGDAIDITEHGDWRSYLASRPGGSPPEVFASGWP